MSDISELKLGISDVMRTAAKSVAMTHEHYQQHCDVMHKLKGKPDAMAAALTQRKEAHVAYHVALSFLKTATLKANPQLNQEAQPVLQAKLNRWADEQLNRLIGDGKVPETAHQVMIPQQELEWS